MISKRLIPRIPGDGQANPEANQPITGDEQMKEGENNFSNINTAPTQERPENPSGEKTAEQKKKIRCKKWPMCKHEGCEYSHPKETVRIFFNLILVSLLP